MVVVVVFGDIDRLHGSGLQDAAGIQRRECSGEWRLETSESVLSTEADSGPELFPVCLNEFTPSILKATPDHLINKSLL
jgi:hypothetical protein